MNDHRWSGDNNYYATLSSQSRKVASLDHEIKMGITTVPPMQPQDKIPLRVHTVDHTCCRLQVRVDSTARALVNEACAKLKLDAVNFVLCEVKSSGERNPLDDNDISVHSEMSVNGRLYIVSKTYSEKTVVCELALNLGMMPCVNSLSLSLSLPPSLPASPFPLLLPPPPSHLYQTRTRSP